ncbi:MAG: sigma-70 family RNA polymerase sigma factor, partial [Candidatus Nanopelagicales bacterium]
MTLEELFDAHAQQVRRYFVRRLGDGSDPVVTADDLTGDVFVVAWRRRESIPDGAELPWLYAVARWVLANHRRRPTEVVVADLGDVEEIDDADPGYLVTEDVALRTAWQQLSPRDREVLRLSAWEGLDGSALATALGISVSGAG